MDQLNIASLKQILKTLSSGKAFDLAEKIESAILNVQAEQTKSQAIVESAVVIDQDLQSEIASQVIFVFPFIKTVSFKQNPQILGGLKITAGDNLLDFSLSHKIHNLAHI